MKKRMLCIACLTALAALLTAALCLSAGAEVTASGTSGGMSWTFENGRLTITGEGEMMDYLPTGTRAPWWDYSDSIKRITVGEGITAIGQYSFYQCAKVTTVDLPTTLQRIGSSAFIYCSTLGGISSMPEGLKSIGSGAFMYCTSFKYVGLPYGLETLGSSCFQNSGLTDITVPGGIGTLGNAVFKNCLNLKDAVLKRGIAGIGAQAFQGCSVLSSVAIPQTVTAIGSKAFNGCSALAGVGVAEDTTWESDAFDANTVVSRTDGVTRSGVTGDLTWKIVDNVLTVEGSGPIPDCTCTYSSYYQSYSYNTPWGSLSDVDAIVIGEGVTRIGDYAFGTQSYESKVRSLQLPSTLKSIGAGAFRDNVNIQSLVIPEGVESVGPSAFARCFYINTLTLPSTLRSIGNEAFFNLSISELVIPDGIATIPSSAFASCQKLRRVTVPASVTRFESNAFDNCTGVDEVNYLGARAEDWAQLSFGNMHANPLAVGGTYQSGRGYTSPRAKLYVNGSPVTALRMTAADGSISPYAFIKCTNAFTLTMDAGYSGSIGEYAFFACVNLTDVHLAEGVSSIGGYAFNTCSGIDEIHIPDSVVSIGPNAFESCYRYSDGGGYAGLSAVTLGRGLGTIGQQAFYNCNALQQISFLGKGPSIGANAFLYVCADISYRPGASWSGKIQNYGGTLTWTPVGGACGGSARWTLGDEGALTLSGSGAITSAPWLPYASEITSVTLADGTRITGYPNDAFAGVAGAYAGSCGDSAAWLIAPNGTLTVTGEGDMADYSDNNQPWFNHSEIKTVDVRAGITGIGRRAFSGVAYPLKLTSISLADSVKSIGEEAFINSINCASVSLPSGLEQIGQRAFCGAALTGVSLPANVNYIAPDAFQHTHLLAAFEVAAGNGSYVSSDGVLYTADMAKLVRYPTGRSGATYVIPEGVEAVGAYALPTYYECPLRTLVFPASLERLEGSVVEDPYGGCINTLCFLGSMPAADGAFEHSQANAFYTRNARLFSWNDPSALGDRLTWNSCCAWSDGGVIADCSLEDVAEVPAGCETAGVEAHRRCSVCGFRITNYGRNVDDDSVLAIPATGHAYGEPAFRRVEDGEGFEAVFSCEACDTVTVVPAEPAGDPEVVNATCTEAGRTIYPLTATLDGQTCTGSLEEIIPAGHTPVVIAEGFAATCTEPGLSDEIFCEVCEQTLQAATEIPPLGHADIVTLEAVAATCTEPGRTEEHSCERCGMLLQASEEIPAAGHTYGEPEFLWAEDGSSCQAAFTCGKCGDALTLDAEVTAEVTLQPTCTEKGNVSYSATVALGGVEYAGTMQLDVPEAGHKPVVDPAVEPTDREPGLTEGRHCGVCNAILEAQQEIPALWSYDEAGTTVVAYNGTQTDLVIPDGVTALSNTLFKNNTVVTSVRVPEGVEILGTQAFYGCTAMTDIWLPDGLEGTDALGAQTFYNCPARLYATAGSTTATLLGMRSKDFVDGDYILRHRVTSLSTGATATWVVRYIGDGREVSIPAAFGGVPTTEIRTGAFTGCTGLAQVTIPETVTAIAGDAFEGCPEDLLILAGCASAAREFAQAHGFGWSHDPLGGAVDAAVPCTCTQPGLSEGRHCDVCGEVLIPQAEVPATGHTPEIIPGTPATRIATGLTEGERCTVCGEILSAQQEIPMLPPLLTPDFTVPASLKVIDDEAFAGIAATAVALPEDLESIGDRAFAGCAALKQIQIPAGVKHIGDGVFDGCPADLLIIGEFDTPAESYAHDNGIAFQDAEGHTERPD